MKFYPPAIIRHFGRYICLCLFVGYPIYFTTITTQDVSVIRVDDRPFFVLVGCLLILIGCVVINLAFLEKCFGTLILDESEIIWRCPFRKTRVISVANCKEIGGHIENIDSGIPFEIIYFSVKRYPQQEMNKYGVIRCSNQYIKFWYSEELYRYVVKNYPNLNVNRLVAHYQKRKRYK